MGMGLAACGEDPAPGGAELVRISVTPPAGQVGGSPLSVTVTALAGGAPMAQGTVIDVGELGAIDPTAGPLIGWWGNDPSPSDANRGLTAATITNLTGSATVQFNCATPGTSTLIAALRGKSNINSVATVTCSAGPEGNWTISSIAVTEGQLRVGSNDVKITATAVDINGDPVEAGVGLKFSIESGTSLTFASNNPSVSAQTSAEGTATVNMKTGTAEGETVVRVDFANQAFGQGSSESFRVRPAGGSTETELEVVVKRAGLAVGPNDRTVLADGGDFLTIEATVIVPDGVASDLTGHEVTFAKAAGPGYFRQDANDGSERSEYVGAASAAGTASVQFLGGETAGGASLTISTPNPDPAGEATVQATLTIAVTALGFIEFEGVTPNVLYVKGSGQNESATLTFKVLDTNRQVLRGVPVSFDIQNKPSGTTWSPDQAVTNETGRVETTVQSGTGTGGFSVSARATVGSVTLEAPSSAIPIVGALPNRAGFTLNCDFRNMGGFIGRQGGSVVVNEQIQCRSVLSDRFGNRVGVQQTMAYMTEGGNIVSPQTTVRWDTAASPLAPPPNVGTVAAPYSPVGQPPCDVDDLEDQNEPWWEDGRTCDVVALNCAARTLSADRCRYNPRDGLVTIVAITRGEEAFTDANNNGEYDEGEPFWDIGEPYVDSNDSNDHDSGEEFMDLSSNGNAGNARYDGPNGEWDNLTSIWTVTHVLLTGDPVYFDTAGIEDSQPQTAAIGHSFAGNPHAEYAGEGTSALSTWWLDKNLNLLNSSTRFSFEVIQGGRGVMVREFVDSEGVDKFAFMLEYNEENLAANIKGYRTDVFFGSDWPGNVYTLTFERQNAMADAYAVVAIRAAYQTLPSVGTTVTVERRVAVALQ